MRVLIIFVIFNLIGYMGYSNKNMEKACFGGGCFWCTEAVFERLKGVENVVSGYVGGKEENPTYEEVCSGETGHAEAVMVYYDPLKVNFSTLIEVFFKTHDPTTLNRQGADVGTQYRSIICYMNDSQKKTTLNYIQQLNDSKEFEKPIVTQVQPFEIFFKAEKSHQDFYKRNPNQPYCKFVIDPKLEKSDVLFDDLMKR